MQARRAHNIRSRVAIDHSLDQTGGIKELETSRVVQAGGKSDERRGNGRAGIGEFGHGENWDIAVCVGRKVAEVQDLDLTKNYIWIFGKQHIHSLVFIIITTQKGHEA